MRVLAWGAVDAVSPTDDAPQAELKLDYAGGWGKYYVNDPKVKALQAQYQRLKRSGKPYLDLADREAALRQVGLRADVRDEVVPRLVPEVHRAGARVVRDRVHGARRQPLGGAELAARAPELRPRPERDPGRVGAPPLALDDGSAGADDRHGLVVAPLGPPLRHLHLPRPAGLRLPLDLRRASRSTRFGRNLYVDTLDSAYGPGWKRENSFLTHKGTGAFCYSVNPHGSRPAGKGVRYRATIQGPGVTPDVMWEGVPLGAYDKAADETLNATIAALNDTLCRPN